MTKKKLYQWTGITCTGEQKSGLMLAENLAMVKVTLRRQEIISKKISKTRGFLLKNKKISSKEITFFSRQMTTLTQAGIPLLQSFEVLAQSQTNQHMKELIESIKKKIETGLTFAESIRMHPSFFNPFFCSLIEAGEKSGTLETMLDQATSYREKLTVIKKKIQKACLYPLIVFLIAQIITAGLLIFVVPHFRSLYHDFGASLPLLTRQVIFFSTMLQSYGLIIGIILGGLIWGSIYAKNHNQTYATWLDQMKIKTPILGPILTQAIMARFSRTLSIIFAAGLPLVDALQSVTMVVNNHLYSHAIEQIRTEISAGQSMRNAMENTRLFPNLVIQMIAVGEESGSLDQMLAKLADFYEENLTQEIELLNSLLEPLLMVLLGLLVSGIIIAMYLPLFKLGSIM